MDDISIPEFIALVAEQLKEANQKANDRIRKTKDDPFLGLRDVQLQLAFTAEKSKTTEGHIELKPWVVAAGGTKSSSERDAIVHTITINLTLMVVEPSPDEPSAKDTSSVSRGHAGGGGGGANFDEVTVVYAPNIH